MPAGFSPVKGATGPAPNTVWFGGVAERLNMLRRWDGALDGASDPVPTSTLSGSAANFANQGGLFGATLGAFTTAPDGTTNTAQLIQEDGSNGQHQIWFCDWYYTLGRRCKPTGLLRLTGYWKPAPTPRRLLYEVRLNNPGFGYPVGDLYGYVIFDLAGGQIGVAPTKVNDGFPAIQIVTDITMSASIVPAPGGFFLCTLEYSLNNYQSNSFFQIRIGLDQGTGTNPRNDSYTGTTGGVYGWKINQMPPGAYAINQTTFFDDFLTLDSIDVHNTKVAINPATGKPYKWFVDANMSEWTLGVTVPGASSFNISSPSILKLTPDYGGGTQITMTSWTNANLVPGGPTGPGANPGLASPGIGQLGLRMPMLVEINTALGIDTVPWGGVAVDGGGGGMAFWGETVEWFLPKGGVGITSDPAVSLIEVDYMEIGAGGGSEQFVPHLGFPYWAYGNPGVFPTDGSQTGGSGVNLPGTGLYQGKNVYRHSGSSVVMNGTFGTAYPYGSDGIKYQQVNFPAIPVNTPPPDGGAHWSPLAAPPPPTRGQPAIPIDMTAFNTWSTLLLPWHGSPGYPNGPQSAGMCMQFFNGCYVGGGISWSPNTNLYATFSNTAGPHAAEGQQRILFVAADQSGGVPMYIDWIRIMQ